MGPLSSWKSRMRWGLCLALGGCLGDIEVPPDPPTISPVSTPTGVPRQVVSGTKPVGTAVFDGDAELVPADDSASWSREVTLVPGDNVFVLKSVRPSGLESLETVTATIVFEPPCPDTPRLSPPPRFTRERAVSLSGTKSPLTSVWLDDEEIAPLSEETTWSYDFELSDADGAREFVITARNERGASSDPARFTIALDRAAPTFATRYPGPAEAGVPTNALLWITFDEPILVSSGTPAIETVTVERQGLRVPGSLVYLPESSTLVWLALSGALEPEAEYTVRVDPSLVVDRVGNQGAPADEWTWRFTTALAPDQTEPPAPTVDERPVAALSDPSFILSGSKGPRTSIYLNGQQIIGPTPEATWSYALPLAVGTTTVALESRSVTDLVTTSPAFTIERVVQRPEPPTLDPSVPSEVTEPTVQLLGTRPPSTSVLLDGTPIACAGEDPAWLFDASLRPGANELNLQTRDTEGVTSESLIHTVTYAQQYDGEVPEDYQLSVQFELRDLSEVPEIRQEFNTGPNNFAVEVWVEGPIELGETCEFVDEHRQNVKYVATIQHYIGTKAQHKVPFADEDYRGADYLASLVTGGVFTFLGLDPQAQRRGADGRELAGLLSGLTEEDLRSNVDCFGSPLVDICTRATTGAGLVEVGPWTPRRRNGQGLLEQGDYLLFIQLNMDRDGSWLQANDKETCWGYPEHRARGMHRVVRRISLGSEPYVLQVPQSEELSGPDREGAGRLHYVGDDGVTVRWGPVD